METRVVRVPDGLAGERLDAALSRMFGLSRTRAARLVEDGDVLVDDRAAMKSDRVIADSVLEIRLPEPEPTPADRARAEATEPQSGADGADVPRIRIVYDDPELVVVDKPAGVAAHPSVGWTGPTVTGQLRAAGQEPARAGAAERQGIVHRLDVGTSGLMVVAKSERAYSALKAAFHDREVDKTYQALAQGHPDPSSGTIDAPIGRHPNHDWRFAVIADGRPSITHYETLEAFPYASLLQVGLETGRTHQIRVHLSAVGHPCCGDTAYGADPTLAARLGLTRQWLHAFRLAFDHPAGGERVTFTADPPADLAAALDTLRDVG